MQKPRLGVHIFRKLPTEDQPSPCDQTCIVTGLNLDGTVSLIAFEADGEQFLYENATIAQASDDCPCHYQPAGCEPQKFKGGGTGQSTIAQKWVLWYSPDDSDPLANLVGYQAVIIDVPFGVTVDDFNQGTCSVIDCDGPHFTGAGASPPIPPPVTPFNGPAGAITGGTVPWWWIAGLALTAPKLPITDYRSTTGTTQPYYY